MHIGPCAIKLKFVHNTQGGFIEMTLDVCDLSTENVIQSQTAKLFPDTECFVGPFRGVLEMGFTRIELPINWGIIPPEQPVREMFEPEDLESSPFEPDMLQ